MDAVKRVAIAIVAAAAVFLVAPAYAGQAFAGRVVHVVDGDTIAVLHDGREERVRLTNIDCPERRQAFGRQATYATSALTRDVIVTVAVDGRDRYGRTLGEVLLPDGTSLNRTLVRMGWAWNFTHYSKDPLLTDLEAQARAAQRGLWADPNPVPPWLYRKQRLRP
jgi:endonuclease YncB( thermonuclease family)